MLGARLLKPRGKGSGGRADAATGEGVLRERARRVVARRVMVMGGRRVAGAELVLLRG